MLSTSRTAKPLARDAGHQKTGEVLAPRRPAAHHCSLSLCNSSEAFFDATADLPSGSIESRILASGTGGMARGSGSHKGCGDCGIGQRMAAIEASINDHSCRLNEVYDAVLGIGAEYGALDCWQPTPGQRHESGDEPEEEIQGMPCDATRHSFDLSLGLRASDELSNDGVDSRANGDGTVFFRMDSARGPFTKDGGFGAPGADVASPKRASRNS